MSFITSLICKCRQYNIKFKKSTSNPDIFSNNLIITDGDKFYSDIYKYYYNGGYKNTKTQIILDNIIYLFTIHFLIINLFFIEWSEIIQLSSKKEHTGIIELSQYISFKAFNRHYLLGITLYFFLIYYYINFLLLSIQTLLSMRNIKNIFHHKFHLKSKDLESLSFNQIMNYVIDLQNKENFCRVKDTITKYDIISRILRRENYITALISNNVMRLTLFNHSIGTNYVYKIGKDNFMSLIFKSNEVEINKNIFILNYFRLVILGKICMQLLSIPGEVIGRIVFFLFGNAENFRSGLSFTTKKWSMNTLIMFKNYNELKHHFDNRIHKSLHFTNNFLLCFQQKIFSIGGKSFIIIGGSIIFVFFIVSLINIKLTNITIFGYNFLWIAYTVGIVIGIFSRSSKGATMYNNEFNITYTETENFKTKQKGYKKIINGVQNIPSDWNKTRIYLNYKPIMLSYVDNIRELFLEGLSIGLCPLIWVKIMLQAREIISFVKTFSTHIDGVGTVCSFSICNSNVYKSIVEKHFGFHCDKWRSDMKFINSMLYYEKEFMEDNNMTELSEDIADVEQYNEEDNGFISLSGERHKKENLFTAKTGDLIYGIYENMEKERNGVGKEEFLKNIYYYISSVNGINTDDIVNKMSNDNVNYVTV